MTTIGYGTEHAEIETLLHNLCGDLLDEPDPLIRYTALTAEQARYDALVSAIKRERGKALADMVAAGASQGAVAESTGLGTQQRVSQLIAAAAKG